MKRLILILNTFLILALNAQEIRIRVPDTSLVAGNELLLPVYADSTLTGKNVTSYQFEFTYNNTLMTPVEVVHTGTLSNQFQLFFQNIPDNKIRIAGAGSAALSGKGVLFYIRCQTIKNGGMWFDFADLGYNYLNEGNVAIIKDRGYISILAPPNITVNVNKYLIKVGDAVQASAYGGTAPYTWELNTSGIATIDGSGAVQTTSHGKFRVKAIDSQGFFDSSNVVTIAPFYLWMPDTTEWQGGSISLPVYFRQLSTPAAVSGEFVFNFNGNILVNPKLELTNTLFQNGGTVEINTQKSGEITIGFAKSTPVSNSGVICFIKFDVSAQTTGYSNLNITSANINQNDAVFTKNGSFRTVNWATIYVTGPNYMMAGQNYQYSSSGGVTPYAWDSSDPALVSVNSSGMASVLMGGTVYIKATDNVGASGMKENIPIYDLEAVIPDTLGPLNGWLSLPVHVSAIPNSRTYSSFEMEITFNANYLEFKNVISTGTHSQNWSIFANAEGNKLKIAAAGSNQVSSAGTLVKIQFALKPDFNLNQISYVNFASLMLNEGIPTVRTVNGSIRAANIDAIDQVSVSALLDVYPNPSSGRFTVKYNGSWDKINSLNFYDVSGKLIHSIQRPDEDQYITIPMVSGIYFMEAVAIQTRITKRIVIQ